MENEYRLEGQRCAAGKVVVDFALVIRRGMSIYGLSE